MVATTDNTMHDSFLVQGRSKGQEWGQEWGRSPQFVTLCTPPPQKNNPPSHFLGTGTGKLILVCVNKQEPTRCTKIKGSLWNQMGQFNNQFGFCRFSSKISLFAGH